ncbi:MAG: putative lipid II flippase FtsW [Opitutales bacterium]|nr:putative lipid II flippase FtsW [Opitutales bacterium]
MKSEKQKTEGKSLIPSWLLFLLFVIFLTTLGLVILISAGSAKEDSLVFFKKQATWLVIATVIGTAAAFINLNLLRKYALHFGVFSVLTLIAVAIPHIGKVVNGARRWIEVGPITFQPSDIGKIALVVLLAWYLQNNQRYMKTFLKGFLYPMTIAGFFFLLIIIEPDFGTATLCAIVSLSMIFLAGTKFLYIIAIFILGVAGILTLVYFDPVRWARLTSYLDLENNKLDGAYQLYQAILGFGAGGVDGAGLGQGRQQQFFLPEAHTDFIFAIVGEELGLVFTLLVVAAFFAMFLIVVSRLKKAPNIFELYIAAGSMLMITLQSIFNMGVVTGMFPTKGISLPFLSYGGSNLVAMSVFAGLLVNCLRSWNKPIKIKATLL